APLAHCIFEHVYFARPDSYVFGRSVNEVRTELGRVLARESAPEADVVSPIPASGVCAASGFAEVSGIPMQFGLIRNHYIGRTFIQPQQAIRHFSVRVKLNPVRSILEGKRVVLVDDSFVRGTTSRKIVRMVRAAGAQEVHVRISCPPTVSPCFYGVDTPRRSELIAATHSLEEIREYLEADSVVADQEPSAPQMVTAAQLQAAIAKLGDLDYTARTNASRIVRRTASAQAVPALLAAVADQPDGYVRYRSLVLLTGFNDPRTKDSMRESLGSPNDRLRAVAYSFFERNPDPAMVPQFLTALDKEQGEFVRPALVRALAALGADPRVRQGLVPQVTRGEDFFRSAVIEALGDYKAQYAIDTITAVAKLEGPLQDDAALALGKIGDKRALETLAAIQRTAPRPTQPSIAAAICLLGVNCES